MVWSSDQIPGLSATTASTLDLCCNDDVEGMFGCGLADNQGEMEIEVSLQRL